MPRESHTARIQVQPQRQFQPQHGQRDGNAAPGFQQHIEETVVGVVVVVDVAAEIQVEKEKLVQGPQALQGRRIRRHTPLQAGQQLVHIAQHLLHIELGVFVLRQAGGSLQQWKVLVALHQT